MTGNARGIESASLRISSEGEGRGRGMVGVCRLRYGFLENGIAESRIAISIGVLPACLWFFSLFFFRIESSNLPCKLTDIPYFVTRAFSWEA